MDRNNKRHSCCYANHSRIHSNCYFFNASIQHNHQDSTLLRIYSFRTHLYGYKMLYYCTSLVRMSSSDRCTHNNIMEESVHIWNSWSIWFNIIRISLYYIAHV